MGVRLLWMFVLTVHRLAYSTHRYIKKISLPLSNMLEIHLQFHDNTGRDFPIIVPGEGNMGLYLRNHPVFSDLLPISGLNTTSSTLKAMPAPNKPKPSKLLRLEPK